MRHTLRRLVQEIPLAPKGMNLKPMLIVALFATSMLAGCFGEDDAVDQAADEQGAYPQPWERSQLSYDDQDIYARVTVNGSHQIDAVRSVYVAVPSITAADGGAGLTLSLIHI